MSDNLFSDLIPQAKPVDPFADLIPKAASVGAAKPVSVSLPPTPPDDPSQPNQQYKSALQAPKVSPIDLNKPLPGTNPFADLIPPKTASFSPIDILKKVHGWLSRGNDSFASIGDAGVHAFNESIAGPPIAPKTTKWMRDHGVFNDPKSPSWSPIKALNEQIANSVAAAYDVSNAVANAGVAELAAAAGTAVGAVGGKAAGEAAQGGAADLLNYAMLHAMARGGEVSDIPHSLRSAIEQGKRDALQAVAEGRAVPTGGRVEPPSLTEGGALPSIDEMLAQGLFRREGDRLILTDKGAEWAKTRGVPLPTEARHTPEAPKPPETTPPVETPPVAAPAPPEAPTGTTLTIVPQPGVPPEETGPVSPPARETPTAPPSAGQPEGMPPVLYRGSGRTEQGAVYNPAGTALPILGNGRYWATSAEHAREFGPDIEATRPQFRNPLVIRNDADWRALTKEAGWEFPNPFGRDPEALKADIDRLNALVRSKGHDAVAVLWDDSATGDFDASGQSIKNLRNVFDKPQVFEPAPGAPWRETPVAEEAAAGAPRPDTAAGTGTSVVTPSGRRIDVSPEVVDLSQLVVSHDLDMAPNPAYPSELQPRARERMASEAQVAEIAARLDPALLGHSPTADVGGPIVGPDNVVESGNGRVLAIQRAYRDNLPGAQRYREWLAQQGYDTTGMAMPVLVRRRTTELSPEDRVAFTREANQRTTLGMSASELAASDARMIPDSMLNLYKGGALSNAGNRDFVREFSEKLPASERAELATAEGGLSQAGLQRLQNALFAKAWGDTDMISALREDPDANFRAIGGALTDIAPRWAAMRAKLSKAGMTDIDATPHIVDAVNLVRRARDQGQPIRMMVYQDDMFGGRVDPLIENALKLFFKEDAKGEIDFRKQRARADMAEGLGRVAQEAEKTEAGPGLFPDLPVVQISDILQTAAKPIESLFPELPTQGMREVPPLAADIAEKAGRLEGLHAENFGPEGILGSGTAFQRIAAEQMRRDAETAALQADKDAIEAVEEELPDTAAAATAGGGAGSNYKGLRQDVWDPGATRRRDIMRREKIIDDLSKAFGIPVYRGRIKGRNMLGFYRKRIEELRIKRQNDMEVTAHELAHMLDDRYPEIRAQWMPRTAAKQPVRDELAGVSYDKAKLDEGFAEFIRLWMSQPTEAFARAPLFHRWFESWLDRNPGVAAPLRKAQTDMEAWFNQNALDRMQSKMGLDRQWRAIFENLGDKWRQGAIDRVHGIYMMEKGLTGSINPGGAYESMRLAAGSRAIVEGALRWGVPTVESGGRWSFTGKGLEDILSPIVPQLNDWILYAVGRSAGELARQGRERLFTNAEIKAAANLETPEFKKAFEEYQEWNKGIVDFAEKLGLIDPTKRALWQRELYIPFYRVVDPKGVQAGKGRGETPGAWSGIKALTGGTGNLRDIMGNIVNNAAMLIDAAIENNARLQVADLARHDVGGHFMVKIGKDSVPVRVDAEQVARLVANALGVSANDPVIQGLTAQLDPMLTFFQHGMAPHGRNIVTVLRGGKPEYYEVGDPFLFRALSQLRPAGKNAFMHAVIGARRLMQSTITFHPNFMAAHLTRDAIQGWVLSQNGFKPLFDSARGVTSRMVEDQNYKDFVANGGGLFGAHLDGGQWRKYLEAYYGNKGIPYETIINTPRKVKYMLEKLADAGGSGTRIGEFRRAVANGVEPRHAAYLAREIASDFAMHGDHAGPLTGMIGFLSDAVPFFNASLVSSDRLIRSVYRSEEARLAVGARLALLSAGSIGLYMYNRTIPDYEALPDWDKDMHWHFYLPMLGLGLKFSVGGDSAGVPGMSLEGTPQYLHLRMPKAWEIGMVASLAERTAANIIRDYRPETIPSQFVHTILDFEHIDPLEGPLQPVFETLFNTNLMTWRPLISQEAMQVAPWEATRPGLHPVLRKFGEMERNLPETLQMRPTTLDAFIHSYLGNFAETGLMIADRYLSPIAPAERRWDEVPVVRRFVEQAPGKTTRYVEDYYDALDAAVRETSTVRDLAKKGEIGLAQEWVTKHPSDIERYRLLEQVNKKLITPLNKIRDAVSEAPDLKTLREIAPAIAAQAGSTYAPLVNIQKKAAWNDVPKLKRVLIDALFQLRNDRVKQVVDTIEPPPKPLIPR